MSIRVDDAVGLVGCKVQCAYLPLLDGAELTIRRTKHLLGAEQLPAGTRRVRSLVALPPPSFAYIGIGSLSGRRSGKQE